MAGIQSESGRQGNSRKEFRWFDEGAAALARYLADRPPPAPIYACPLCGLLMDRSALESRPRKLTIEHVPPEAVGGREMLLTCNNCNSKHGSWFDSQAEIQHRLRRAFSGQSSEPEEVILNVGGVSGLFSWYQAPGGMVFAAIPPANNPADLDEIGRRLRQPPQSSVEQRVRWRPRATYSSERASLSWVRAAYLTCFALFGWYWLRNPVLDPIRRQLQDRDGQPLPLLGMIDTQAHGTRRQVLRVEKPINLKGLLIVAWDNHVVFLPGVGAAANALTRIPRELGATGGAEADLEFVGDLYPWPTKPLYLADQ